jgi:hypothetical protein
VNRGDASAAKGRGPVSPAPLALGIVAFLCAVIAAVLIDTLRTPASASPREAPFVAPRVVQRPAPVVVVVEPEVVAPLPAAPPATPSAPAWPSNPARLVRALAPLQREVSEGLAGLDRAAGCAWGDMFARLTLSTGEGEVRIEQLELWRRPPAPEPDAPDHDPAAFTPREIIDEAAAACVRQALAHRSFKAPAAKPGRRWETAWP